MHMKQPIAVIGLACRFPGAPDAVSYWDLLRNGRSGVGRARAGWDDAEIAAQLGNVARGVDIARGGFLPDPDLFDPLAFGISRREALEMDPQQRLLLEVAMETMENAGVRYDRPSSTGVFVGISGNDYAFLKIKGSGGYASINVFTGTGNTHSIAANRISYLFDLRGPSMAIDTACSSSMVAVHYAMRTLDQGDCQMALAGGVNFIMSPEVSIGFARSNMLSPSGECWTFDARADGYVRGEGCGFLLLKRLDEAERDGDRILALLHGSATNQDGSTRSMTRPNLAAQVAVIRAALNAAAVEANAIGYVEAHGTGTPLGDPVETEALIEVFGGDRRRGNPLPVGSVKANIGHLETAAGIAGLIKAILALRHGRIPPQRNFETANPRCRFDEGVIEVPRQGRAWRRHRGPRMAGVSGFGFGGTNCHVVVGEAPAVACAPDSGAEWRVVTLSVRNRAALPCAAAAYVAQINWPTAALADVARTTTEGRAHHAHRRAFVAKEPQLLCAALAEAAAADAASRPAKVPTVTFLFAGDGAPLLSTGPALYAGEASFRQDLDAFDAVHRQLTGRPLVQAMFGEADIAQARLAAAARLALQLATARLWRHWGVVPQAWIADPAGEVAAACDAGTIRLVDAMRWAVDGSKRRAALPPCPNLTLIEADGADEGAVFTVAARDILVAISADGAAKRFFLENGETLFVPSFDSGQNSVPAMLGGLAALYERGIDVDWAAVNRGRGNKIELPPTPFIRDSYWFDREGKGYPSSPPALIRQEKTVTANMDDS